MKVSPDSAADLIARLLKRRGVTRVFALCGGHIMPIWMRLDAEGVRIIDVRDERAAVHMAQAHAELTGELGVALVTAGPGMTNAITGIANAHVSRAPVLVLSGGTPGHRRTAAACRIWTTPSWYDPSRATHAPSASLLWSCRSSMKRSRGHLGKAVSPVRPTSTSRPTRCAASCRRHCSWKNISTPSPVPSRVPTRTQVQKAVDLLWSARRVLVISGRGARGAGPELISLLDRLGAVYLDTGESRGLVPDSHPSVVGAMRGAVMGDADVILTVGRRLDFQLAYGSPAVFQSAKFVRISDTPSEMRDNRRGAVEILASPAEISARHRRTCRKSGVQSGPAMGHETAQRS